MSLATNSKPAYTQFYGLFEQEHNISVNLISAWLTASGVWISSNCRKLTDMILEKFRLWEVFTLDESLFFVAMNDIFKRYKDYYGELITAYQTEINFLDGDKVTTNYENDNVLTPRAQYETVNYDLPRSQSNIDRPTTKMSNGGVSGTDTTHYEGETVRKGGNVIELKKKYMDLLRNVFDEFAEKFRPNFIELFDGLIGEEY